MDGGNVKLATLISQAAGDFEFREDLRTQLELWRQQRIDVHIDEGIRKVYALLAGVLDVVEGSGGSTLERCKDVDVFAGLDWKRTFGVHLWFAEPMDAPIAQVFESYNRQRLDTPDRARGPRAWYVEHPPPPSAEHIWNLPLSLSTPDALFSLIQLHSDPTYSLSQVFNPLSFGPSPLDYSLPWHLYIILSRCMRIRDFSDRGDPGAGARRDENNTDADDDVEGHSPSADLLASGYALQLENLGLLQEAVFVLLHIEGSAGYVILLPLFAQI
jgi:nuclear pore complex protein Nup98-Nup96